ncbi:hypothetical protein VCHA39O220_70204 [Vibrio chagasii]|nr:hypothetical protein VCHA35O143_140096 [Vibrio chagasii]CAH6832041.1 hypothetical protein VCHA31O73_10042 [Vibrio chagasii]CAH6879644.1 hypothetical protein VCHA34P117_20095 [Vibrio chagasii]CAH6966105.1 hypothetical protein VCHA53O480_140094 [Vibrio chagasii]CAH7001645.1 hypothetical protein VCHA50O396_140042 [Vibrio chagasii]
MFDFLSQNKELSLVFQSDVYFLNTRNLNDFDFLVISLANLNVFNISAFRAFIRIGSLN